MPLNVRGASSTYLRKAGVLQSVGPRLFEVTDRAREILRSNPASIDVAYLEERFATIARVANLAAEWKRLNSAYSEARERFEAASSAVAARRVATPSL